MRLRLFGPRFIFFEFLFAFVAISLLGPGQHNTARANDQENSISAVESSPVEHDVASAIANTEKTSLTICLSPGHPSFEGDKYFEAVLNRKVAWLLEYRLARAGYNAVFAVDDLTPMALFFSEHQNDDETLWSGLMVMSPEEKANRCNQIGADYVISIHHNFAVNAAQNQTMVFYTMDEVYRPVHREAKRWAETTAAYLGQVMETDESYAISDMERLGFQLGILTNSTAPGILTEASFYSNPDERRRLSDDTYLNQEAEAIFNAFIAHLKRQTE